MIASSALPLAAPLVPAAAPAMVAAWGVLHAGFLWSLLRSGGSLYAPNTTRLEGGGLRVALTFDDGPRGDETRRLLDVLGEAGVRAAFFVVGRRAVEDPEVVRRMDREGHTVGNHTMNHLARWAATGRSRATREVAEAQSALGEITGRAPALFRPPMGHKNVYLAGILEELQLRQVTWSTRSWDTVVRRTGPVARRVLARSRPGEIVLLHEGLRGGEGGRPLAPELTAALIRGLRDLGLSPVSLSELLPSPARPAASGPAPPRPGASSDEPAR